MGFAPLLALLPLPFRAAHHHQQQPLSRLVCCRLNPDCHNTVALEKHTGKRQR